MRSVDSVYEFAGYGLAEGLRAALAGLGLPLLVALAGTAFMVHRLASERASVRDLGVHVFGLLAILWLLSPAATADLRAPRFVLWLGEAADRLQRKAVEAANAKFLDDPFAWERLAMLAGQARVVDPGLEAAAGRFLAACARPALAASDPASPNLFRPGALPYDPPCETVRGELWAALERHVKDHPAHRRAVEAARRHDPSGAAAFQGRYLEEVCLKLIDGPGSPLGEPALVAAAVGEYSYADPAQSTGRFPMWVRGVLGWLLPDLWDRGANAAVTGLAELQQGWDNRFTAKQRYYLATTAGPHVYGFVMMLVLGLFPLAGLWALVPGHAQALLNYAKIFVSVKLWPAGWAAISAFNAKRTAMEAFDPSPRGSGDVFFAASAMYLLVPAIAFALVHVAARAAQMPFAPALPPPSGSPVSPAAVVVAAARAGR